MLAFVKRSWTPACTVLDVLHSSLVKSVPPPMNCNTPHACSPEQSAREGGNELPVDTTVRSWLDNTKKRSLTFTAHQMVSRRSLTRTALDANILFLPSAVIDQ